MTEAEWLSCDDPARALAFLGDRAGERKPRLFACACCRRAWGLLPDARQREAVGAAERYADGLATAQELTGHLLGADAGSREAGAAGQGSARTLAAQALQMLLFPQAPHA